MGYVVHTLHSIYGDREQLVKDEEWLAEAGEHGYVLLTKDDRLRYRSPEREAMVAAGARVFCLTNRNLTGPQQIERFKKHMNRIVQRARKPGPRIYGIYEDDLRLLFPRPDDS
jgi:hypothetical protein